MSFTRVGVFSVGSIDLGVSRAISSAEALAALLDAILKSPFGLSAFSTQLGGQLAGLLGAQVSLSSALLNPGLYFSQVKNALTSALAVLPTTLSSFVRDLTPQISVNLVAANGVRASLAGIRGLIDLAQLNRLSALELVTALRARLTSGGVAFYVGQDGALPDLAAAFAADGLPPGFSPTAPTYVVILAAQDPAAVESLQFLFLRPP